MALKPEAEKAYTDCTASGKHAKVALGAFLKDDPKRDYFEKMGAQFAAGYFAGTKVAEFDEIDMFECLHAEPTAVEYFYKADEQLKESWIKKDPSGAVKGLDELIRFLGELVMEDYPHTRTQVCKTFDHKDAKWDNLKAIMEAEKDPETTLQATGDKLFFNKKDITTEAGNMTEDYLKQEFRYLGWRLGDTMYKEVQESKDLFLF